MNSTSQVGINQFSDWTADEFKTKMLGDFDHSSDQEVTNGELNLDDIDIDEPIDVIGRHPKSVNWTAKGAVTPVKN